MIEISELYKYYGARRVLGPLSAHIDEGEVVGLLGLNGAGKTTTLRILSCDLLPSSGSVRVNGVDAVTSPDRVRSLVGYLPDTPPLYDEMSVRAYLAFAARLRRVPRKGVKAAVQQALEAAGLDEYAEQPIASLSHGYRQRVGIAQAIVHEPRLVILDEPSSGLDPVQIREMRALVRKLGKRHTVLVSSHNLGEISEICDRLWVIRDGTIVAAGTEEELVKQWLNTAHYRLVLGTDAPRPSVAEFLGALSGVVQVTVAETPAEESVVACDVEIAPDRRGALSRAVVEAGYELLEFSRSERELENVFARLARAPGESPLDGATTTGGADD